MPLIIPIPKPPLLPSILLLPLTRQQQSVFHAAATLQYVGVVGGIVALAYHVRAAELEFFGQRGLALPLYVFFVVVVAFIFAAEDVDFVEPFCGAADAFELWQILGQVNGLGSGIFVSYLRDGGHAAVRSLLALSQREALHVGELDLLAGAEGFGAADEG